mgnify:CR=1 FL=1
MSFNAVSYVQGFSHSGKRVNDLSRISDLLKRLGNPHKMLKFVHIAGTNGKGSTLEYLSDIFIQAGYKTGQFTSPYIEKYNDRIRINGENISDERLGEICVRVKEAVSGECYSQFEITFAIALIYFLEEHIWNNKPVFIKNSPIVMKEDPKHIRISEYNYPLPDERIAKFPLPVRDQSKLLIYRHGEVNEDIFTSLPDYLPKGSLMIFNNTKVIQARLHFRKETGALIEVFCLEPIQPNDYVLNFQQTEHAAWLCMIGNLKKWKDGELKREMTVKGFPITLTATRGECRGTSHWVDFTWNNAEVTFADILEVFGELPIPPYLNRNTEESDKETYQTVYSKIKGSVAAPTAGLHFTPQVLDTLQEKGIELEELTLHVGAGTFKPVKSEEIEGHEMHTEYISVNRSTIKKLIDHDGCAVAVGTTSVRTLESLYHIGVTLAENPDATEEELHVRQWQPYEKYDQIPPVVALQKILGYLDRHGMETLHTSTQIIIAPGYDYKIVKAMVTNFHQPQSTLLLLVSAFVKGNWRTIYDYALSHDFRFLSYGDSSLLIP